MLCILNTFLSGFLGQFERARLVERALFVACVPVRHRAYVAALLSVWLDAAPAVEVHARRFARLVAPRGHRAERANKATHCIQEPPPHVRKPHRV